MIGIKKESNTVECPTGLENSVVKQIVIIFRNKIINDSKTIEPPIICSVSSCQW